MTVDTAGQVAEKLAPCGTALWTATALLDSNVAIAYKSQKHVPFNPEIFLLGIHPKEIIYNKDEAISPSIIYNSTKP